MSFEELLNNKCDIYHMKKSESDKGFGIKGASYNYSDKPDLSSVPCHFNVGDDSASMQQTEDANEYTAVGKLQLPLGTEVYVNDKIVDLENGLSYTAEIPRNIRNHHMIVTIQRKGKVKGAL